MRAIVLVVAIVAASGLASAAPHQAIDVSAGLQHACAVTTTGNVVCWGSHAYDRVVAPTVMPGIKDAVGVAAGRDQSCAVTKAGAVWCWSYQDPLKPTLVAGIDDATQLAASWTHVCALRRGGTVACWGEGGAGQLGQGATQNSATPVAVRELKDVVQIAAGGELSCARLASKRVMCWGNDHGDSSGWRGQRVPVAIENLDEANDLAGGKYQVCAIRGSERVACWGLLALGASNRREIAAITAVDTPVDHAIDIATSGERTCAVRDTGEVSCWGEGLLGDGKLHARSSSPVRVAGLVDAVQVTVASTFACARRAGGSITCWGENRAGQLGIATPVNRGTPREVNGVTSATSVAVGETSACATTKAGVTCWGKGASAPWRVADTAGAKDIVAGPDHFCIRRKDNSSACWGDNSEGQISDARNVGVDDVVELAPDTQQVATTRTFTCTMLRDGALTCQGRAPNADAVTDLDELVAGDDFLCGRSKHDVRCWGPAFTRRDPNPQRMGCVLHEKPPDRSPFMMSIFAGAKQLAARGSDVCALRKTGDVACAYARVERNQQPKATVTKVGSGATQLSIGWSDRRCVRKSNGTVACWDREHTTPKPVPKLTDVVDLAVGPQTSCAVHKTGRVSCWGYNGRGEVGDGTSGDRLTPGGDVNLP